MCLSSVVYQHHGILILFSMKQMGFGESDMAAAFVCCDVSDICYPPLSWLATYTLCNDQTRKRARIEKENVQ